MASHGRAQMRWSVVRRGIVWLLLAMMCVSSPRLGSGLRWVAAQKAFASGLSACYTTYRTRNVIVVSIDGLRATEAFEASDLNLYIPNLNRLRRSGSLYRNVYNLGGTWTTPANYTIVDGCLELAPPSWFYYRRFRPTYPTMFEYYRYAHPEIPQDKVWVVPGGRFVEMSNCSSHPLLGDAYQASVEWVHPASKEENWLLDDTVWSHLQDKMNQYHPSLIFANFEGLDYAAGPKLYGGWYEYTQTIRKEDAIIGQLWDKIQTDEYYRDQTTLLLVASYGRRDDGVNVPDPYFSDIKAGTGGISEGCKHVFVLALGPDIKAGAEFTERRDLTDICPTVGELLGFDTPLAQGRVLSDMLIGYTPQATSSQLSTTDVSWQDEVQITSSPGLVEQPRVVLNSQGLHVVWVDSRNGQRAIYYKLRSAADGVWSEDVSISASSAQARAPAIAVDGDAVHVVWQDYRLGNWAIYHAQRSADGQWSSPDLVASSVVEGVVPQMVWEPAITVCQGQVLVGVPVSRYWLRVYYRTLHGTWQAETLVDSTHRTDASNRIALPQHLRMASGGEHSYLLWQEVEKITWDLKYSRSQGCTGGWAMDLQLPTELEGGNDAALAVNSGHVYAAWVRLPYLLWSVEPSTFMRNQSNNGGLSWDQTDYGSGRANGAEILSSGCHNTDLAAAPGLTALVWEDYRMPGQLPVIYLSHSADDGATWQEQPISRGNGYSIEPRVATDGRTIYTVWRDNRDGTWQLYLSRVSDTQPAPTPSSTATFTPTATPTTAPIPTSTSIPTPTTTSAPTATPTATAISTEEAATPTATQMETATASAHPTSTVESTYWRIYLPVVRLYRPDELPHSAELWIRATRSALPQWSRQSTTAH